MTLRHTDSHKVEPDYNAKKNYDEYGEEVDLDALRREYFSNLTLPGDEEPGY